MTRWHDLSADPNAATTIEWRRARLRSAFEGRVKDRDALLAKLVEGQDVLDVGCVDQLPLGFEPGPVHRKLVSSASSVLGVDINDAGVLALQHDGYDVHLADITNVSFVESLGDRKFDTIVAGEIVEHILNLDVFMTNCRTLLRAGGHLVLTTPNPASWTLALPNGLGRHTDNVDHVLYLFPGGVAEIAERHGFELSAWFGVNNLTSRRRVAGWVVGRVAEIVNRNAVSACQTLVYVLTSSEGQ